MCSDPLNEVPVQTEVSIDLECLSVKVIPRGRTQATLYLFQNLESGASWKRKLSSSVYSPFAYDLGIHSDNQTLETVLFG